MSARAGVLAPERTRAPLRPRMRADTAAALRERFPARQVPDRWEATCWDRATVIARLAAAPFAAGVAANMNRRRLGLIRFLDWLSGHPGDTWQQRWLASGIPAGARADWRPHVTRWLADAGLASAGTAGLEASVTSGLGQLIYADVLRPAAEWLLASPIRFPLGGEMPRVRDSAGFAALRARADAAGLGLFARRRAIEQVSVILAAKGGLIAGITVGDCLELLEACDKLAGSMDGGMGAGFYQLLHAMGMFPPAAPPTLRMLNPNFKGQLSAAELVGQYGLACEPVRELIIGYLNERRPAVDYTTFKTMAYLLGKLFWKDLEAHNPGISSLRLPPDVAVAWKQRLATKTVTVRDADGRASPATAARMDTLTCLTTVRAFYLDISQWALEDPTRWSPWAAPCPIRREETSPGRRNARRKSRMDQRTRERLPALPVLAAAAARNRQNAAALLATAAATAPGQMFTSGPVTLHRLATTLPSRRIWAQDPGTGQRRDLTREEEAAFWAWAAIEVLRATGIRIEELTELTHHSLVQYRLPATGELIPLLHITRPRPTPKGCWSSLPSWPTC